MPENTPPGSIPAGWYPDPTGEPFSRWWDGNGWTAHTAPPAALPLPAAGPGGDEASTGDAAESEVQRPRTVHTAIGLYLLKVLTMIVLFIASVGSLGTSSATAEKAESQALTRQHLPGITPAQLHTYVTVGLTVGVIFSGLYVVAFVLFAAFAGRGANWARVVLLVLTCVGVLGTGLSAGRLFQDPASILGLLGTVAGVAATILLFVPESRRYFAAVKAWKWSRSSAPRPATVPGSQQ